MQRNSFWTCLGTYLGLLFFSFLFADIFGFSFPFVFTVMFPYTCSFLTLPFFYLVKSDYLKMAFWWPFVKM